MNRSWFGAIVVVAVGSCGSSKEVASPVTGPPTSRQSTSPANAPSTGDVLELPFVTCDDRAPAPPAIEPHVDLGFGWIDIDLVGFHDGCASAAWLLYELRTRDMMLASCFDHEGAPDGVYVVRGLWGSTRFDGSASIVGAPGSGIAPCIGELFQMLDLHVDKQQPAWPVMLDFRFVRRHTPRR